MKATLPGGLVHGERKTVAVKIPKGYNKKILLIVATYYRLNFGSLKTPQNGIK